MQSLRISISARLGQRWPIKVAIVVIGILALVLATIPSFKIPVVRALTATPQGTPAGTPDLVVGFVSISSNGTGCNPGPLGLRVEVRNTGTGLAYPAFEVEANGVRQTVNPSFGLGAGQSYYLWFSGYNYGSPNAVTVDVTNVIAESNEGNNSWSGMVPIPTQPPTCTPDPNATNTATRTSTIGCGSVIVATNTRTPSPTRSPTMTSTASPTRTPTRTNTACGVRYITPTISAEFSGSPRSGTAPLTVVFTAPGSPGSESCTWWYGDGQAIVFDWACPMQHSHVYQNPGTYTVRVYMAGAGEITKTDYIVVQPGAGSPTLTSTPTRTATPTSTSTTPVPCPALWCAPVRINFQPASAPIYSGYLVDGGAIYANRGNGHSYGWNVDNTGWARDRNATNSPDQRYDTLNHMQKGAGSVWEIAIPGGTWSVRIVAGDPLHYDSVYNITAEGQTVVQGTPNSTTRWVDASRNITVSDGRLTIANGAGSSNNKINFIEISPFTTPTPTPACNTLTIRGRVYNSPTGQGIAGATVTANINVYARTFPATADASGNYTITIPAGYGCYLRDLTVTASGYPTITRPLTADQALANPIQDFALVPNGVTNTPTPTRTGTRTPTRTGTPPPTITRTPTAGGPCCGVDGSISMPAMMGGYQGQTIQIPVTFSASGTSPINWMRVKTGGAGCATQTEISAMPAEPYVTSKSYPYSVPINFSSFYVTVQYIDANTHISPLYCGNTVVEGMPAPSPTGTTPTPSTLKVQYRAGDATASINQIKPYLSVVNTGSAGVPLAELKLRYWYTADGTQAQAYACDWAQVGCGNISGSFVKLATARPGADGYLEIGFTSAAPSLAAGAATGEIQSRFNKSDWTNYTQTGDYSFDPTKTSLADWTKVTLYRAGVRVWGLEP